MKFTEADLNSWETEGQYEAIIAYQSLHHVVELEHLFDQISEAFGINGIFVISDMIGRNGHQRWPEVLEIVNKYWRELPKKYKYNLQLKRYENEYENWDCSKEGFEGIRAEDILQLLLERFEAKKFIGFGNAIDVFVDRNFGHHFDPNNKWDTDFIDRVHAEDESAILQGKITPTHMLGIFVKTLNSEPFYSRNVTPQQSVHRSKK